MPEPAPNPAPSRARVFARRFISTLVLWSIVLAAMFSGNKLLSDYFFVAIISILSVLGLVEFYGLAAKTGLPSFKSWGILGGLFLLVGTYLHLQGFLGISGTPARVNDFETSLLVVLVLGLCIRQFVHRDLAGAIACIGVTLFGMMYVPWLLNFIQKINFFHGIEGTWYVLYFIAVTKASDVGAYLIGSLIGRHKMIPRISPGKTWEGLGGAVAVSVGVSLLLTHFAGHHLVGMTPTHAVILGFILGGTAVIGDLIESIFKREAGVKDSGGFFPGIGGILDLLDSLLFNAPLMYLYLRHVLTHP